MGKSGVRPDPETRRLREEHSRQAHWQRWGPYLAERQWGTVREDYSALGDCWSYFPHDHARSRAYRWGEDGLLGICDRRCRLCFGLALWNGKDPILKERLFGLANPEGNHGEDVKEIYAYLDATPTSSYLKAMYRYPQREFPYSRLIEENRRRGKSEEEFELTDTGVFDEGRFFEVTAEYCKASANDVLIRITVENHGPESAPLHLLPTLWFRNTWSWGGKDSGPGRKPRLQALDGKTIEAAHGALGKFMLKIGPGPDGELPELLFTENNSNARRLWGTAPESPYVKDAFHERVIHRRQDVVNGEQRGTKAAAWYKLEIPAGERVMLNARLYFEPEAPSGPPLGRSFDQTFRKRIDEADEFYGRVIPAELSDTERAVARHGYAGLLWTKQFYHYIVGDWTDGDPGNPPPNRQVGRNADWRHLYAYDVISMPDKWEFPWFAAWDLAFHMVPLVRVDPYFVKRQLTTLMREWYMHANGQLPAYEFEFSDVNPPVHAWACWRVYKMTARPGERDHEFLASAFHKLLLNFTWWVNRKDPSGRHLFSGGFLGLDNIGVIDRSKPLPSGQYLEQADGTAWMAFYCGTMLSIALELAQYDDSYEGVASKFFEHFIAITDAINSIGGGLWDEHDGFYYDRVVADGQVTPLRLRSLVGLIPLLAAEVIDSPLVDQLPGFRDRMRWFLENRQDLAKHITLMEGSVEGGHKYLLAIPSEDRLKRVMRYLLDEKEFLSPYGVRSLSKIYDESPFTIELGGQPYTVEYSPGESSSDLFGGNSNWRGPIWFPINFLLIEALERYHHFFGEKIKVECPTGSGNWVTLQGAADEINARLAKLFLPDGRGRRAYHGPSFRYADDPLWRDVPLFHEYFHADTGRGCGASHQTGWTALITRCLEKLARDRQGGG